MTPPRWLHWPDAAGGGGPWTPSQLTDLAAWWQCDLLNGSNGSSVNSLTDSAGTFDFTTASGVTLVAPAQNGLNAVQFSSGSLNASVSYSGGDQGFSVYVLAKLYNGSTNRHISGGNNLGHLVGATSGQAVWVRAYKSDATRYEVQASSWSNGWDIVGFSADFSNGTFDVSLNGSSIHSSSGLAVGVSQAHTFRLGTFGGSFWDGELAEEIIASIGLALSNRQKIEGYLAHKWGLTSNLPSTHPYKSSAP